MYLLSFSLRMRRLVLLPSPLHLYMSPLLHPPFSVIILFFLDVRDFRRTTARMCTPIEERGVPCATDAPLFSLYGHGAER